MSDTSFSSVQSLLHFEGTNGSTTIYDSSSFHRTVTLVNGAKLSTAQAKFGTSSLLLNGSTDYITIPLPSFNIRTSRYTLETHLYYLSNTTNGIFCNDNTFYLQTIGGTLYLGDGTANPIAVSHSMITGNWYHIALSFDLTTYRIYIDGTLVGSTTTLLTATSLTLLQVGARPTQNQYHNGYIDEVRVTIGVTRYTSNFTAPTVAYSNSSTNDTTISSGIIKLTGYKLAPYTPSDESTLVNPGIIKLVGNKLNSTASTLNGGEGYLVRIQQTIDLTVLSDSMAGFAIDFAVSSPHYQTVTNHPYCSITTLCLGGVYVNNLPIDTVTYALPGYNIAYSYLYDFYYRIHTSIRNLQLGNVLSEQIFLVEIWNSWLTATDLVSVTETGLDDVLLDFPITLPFTFKPLQYITGTITVSQEGIATIDGDFYLTFNTENITIHVSGQRVILWPFIPQDTFTETREWNTDILQARHTETRYANREFARLILEFKYTFKYTLEYSYAKKLAKKIAHLALATPLWSEALPVRSVTIGQTIIPVIVAYREYEVGEIVVFWKSYKEFEIKEIADIDSQSITLTKPMVTNLTNCYLLPVKIGYIQEGINLVRDDNHKLVGGIKYTITNPFTLPIWPNSETYDSLPVVSKKLIVSGGLTERYSRNIEIFDNIVGKFITFDVDDYNRTNLTLTIKTKTPRELFDVRRQLDYLMGKYKPFWLPSFNQDLLAQTNLASGATSLKVNYGFWDITLVSPIRVVGSNIQYFNVTASADNGDGTETLALTPPCSTLITNITSVEILTKVRLDTDSISLSHTGKRITNISIPTLEVLD